jgi:hypothetical protein
MDSSWKNLQIRIEAAWNMRTTPKTKRPKTGDIISSAHSLDWNKKKVRQLQQAWNDEVAKLVANCDEVTHAPDAEDLFTCSKCGAEVPAKYV